MSSPTSLEDEVIFTDLSVPGDHPIVSWSWDFGDGATSTEQNPTHKYASAGVYVITLTVVDEFGCEDSVSHPLSISGCPTRRIFGYVYVDGTTVGLPNADVQLWTRVGHTWTHVGTYRTGADGYFEFTLTDCVDWIKLIEINPPEYVSTKAQGVLWAEVINADEIRHAYPPVGDVGPYIFWDKLQPGGGFGKIGDYVWHDANWDGIQDANENPIPHITVWLKDEEGNVLAVTETDENGLYLFEDLYPGIYYVEVDALDADMPFGFMPTTPTVVVVDLGPREVYLDADFGFAAPCPLCPDWLAFHSNRDGNWEIYRLGGDVGLLNLTQNGATDMGVARDPYALWIAYQSDRNGNWDIFATRADGGETRQLTSDPGDDVDPNWNDLCGGPEIAFQSNRDGNWEIYVVPLEGGERRVTFNDAADTDPFWAPSILGRKIAFQSDRNGNWDIYVVDVDSGEEVQMTSSPADEVDPVWSPDGKNIAYLTNRHGTWDVYTVNVERRSETRITRSDDGDEKNPVWSPDSLWIAYQSDRDGNWEVYVSSSNAMTEIRVTDDPATDGAPTWNCDSTELVFHSDRDGNLELYQVNPFTLDDLVRLTDHLADDVCPAWMPAEEDGSLTTIVPARGLILARGW